MRIAPWIAAWAVVAWSSAGCAGDGRREAASRTVELASHALDLVDETSGSEALEDDARARIDPARASAREWASHAQQALEQWRNDESHSIAFETAIPCLGRSLGALRERLAEQRRPIPESLRQAEALARTATEGRCARRRRGHDEAGSARGE